jgi:hypothetical protein
LGPDQGARILFSELCLIIALKKISSLTSSVKTSLSGEAILEMNWGAMY